MTQISSVFEHGVKTWTSSCDVSDIPSFFLNQEVRRLTGTNDREHLFSNLEVHCQSLVSRCSFNSISRHYRIKLTSVRSIYWQPEKTIDRKSDSFDYPPIKNVRFILKYKLLFHWFWIGIISFTIFASTQKKHFVEYFSYQESWIASDEDIVFPISLSQIYQTDRHDFKS